MQRINSVAVIGGGMAGLSAARLLCLRGIAVKLYAVIRDRPQFPRQLKGPD